MDEWEIRQRAAAALASADETLQRLRERQQERAERGESGWSLSQQPEPRSARQRAPQRPVDNWRQRTEQIVDAKLAVIPEGVGIALGQAQKQLRAEMVELGEEIGSVTGELGKKATEQETRIKEQETRIKELESTVAELLAALERRVDELEKRGEPRVRLIAS